MPDGDDVITPAAGPGAPAFVPSPRVPDPAEVIADAPLPAPVPSAEQPDLPAEPRRRGKRRWAGGVLALAAALAVGGGAAYVAQREPRDERAEFVAGSAEPLPASPEGSLSAILQLQAQALFTDDEISWLAVVDPDRPELRTRYRTMFRSLRALGVSFFDPLVDAESVSEEGEDTFTADVQIKYCLAGDDCVFDASLTWDSLPEVFQELTFVWRDDQVLITSVASKKSDEAPLPAPWEQSELFVARGKRLTLVAGPGERKHLKRLLPIAERAATVTDRFAGLVGNLQRHYRIYLADPQQWKTWYGGDDDSAMVGYTQTLARPMTDVVLNMAELKDDPELLALTIQHELGHVATLGGLDPSESGRSGMWLEEGIAEYIGWYPQRATASWSREPVRDAVHGSEPPNSIALYALADDADGEEADAFYGLGHFAASCLADEYGERALFTFVRLYLREDSDLDRASEQAFGKSFKTVDKACVAWIRDKA
ncbi:gluzincin family metallopeptidase [Couchioplanes caeruleus]|uniref:Peptidase MA superfamily protein n=2 Tax=Couchioplanes caeruleus TaxID=56438 RepID=A0A1K0FSY0_9ACTN|nr:hypothetical protein [Couchioplanes caeruleus]OJF15917.1 hypothetical protein BG844_01395 [Couchioplanes caeruleus subsp. caeruleus]ROP28503.1 hypothetical protein EDD30_1267 [Couchioplanes caeruleus]